MIQIKQPVIALLGNPNSGKSSLFNYLTGMHQDVSNFPGVTVDKKSGRFQLHDHKSAVIIDFPGTYSIYPNSLEEKIVVSTLTNPNDQNYPDLVIYVADITQLERHILFATQIIDLGFPTIFIANMIDLINPDYILPDLTSLENYLGVPVLPVSVRNHTNLENLKDTISYHLEKVRPSKHGIMYMFSDVETFVASRVKKKLGTDSLYLSKVIAHHYSWLDHLHTDSKSSIRDIINHSGFNDIKLQVTETMNRYDDFMPIVKKVTGSINGGKKTITDAIDAVITHRILGPVIFFIIMIFVFQSIFSWASFPMDIIESGFATTGSFIKGHMPDVWWTDLLVNGLLAGLGGVLVFVPQIAILFFLIAILEESGYMSRVVYMFDNVMQRFGMNGRSMVSLISSGACAIPSIMSARTISNQKERLITILVSPLISCSARLPVYAVLIGFAVPQGKFLGLLNYQGLAFMGLYLLGILGALVSALFFKKVLKSSSGSYLMIELPNYKPPIWKNVLITVKAKVKAFIFGAGKIIIIISVVLWFMASYGPSGVMQKAENQADEISLVKRLNDKERENLKASLRIQSSFVGQIGKWIEPVIVPLGFDWKIGIALITSFAAREVFVGTMATIYSIGTESDDKTIRQKMAAEIRPGTDIKVYNPATSMSLLVFYVFAMQCMSTLAVVKRETNTWKWPIIQFVYMSAMAYAGAFIVYHLLS